METLERAYSSIKVVEWTTKGVGVVQVIISIFLLIEIWEKVRIDSIFKEIYKRFLFKQQRKNIYVKIDSTAITGQQKTAFAKL